MPNCCIWLSVPSADHTEIVAMHTTVRIIVIAHRRGVTVDHTMADDHTARSITTVVATDRTAVMMEAEEVAAIEEMMVAASEATMADVVVAADR